MRQLFLHVTFLLVKERALISRSSRPEVFCKKSVLINFVKFVGKHLFQSLFSTKVEG